jgi:iron complex outermembrane receptor protein
MRTSFNSVILFFLSLLLLTGSQAVTQQTTTIAGKVVDQQTNTNLAGSNVIIEGTNFGATTDQYGKYQLAVPPGNYVISVSFIGYEINKKKLALSTEPVEINFKLTPRVLPGQEVVITATRAKERETPVAFVDLPRKEITDRYWAQDIPMLLSEVPGIYAYSDAGNGLGYTYLKIRGFDQKRVSVMINGIPLNDPEDHQVYWVNMPDFLSSVHDVQIQRGVGSSLYGTSSFGGSINVITSEMSLPRQVQVSTGMGSYNTQKYSLNLHSGLIDNQYAFSARFSKILSDGYRENSAVDMWSYFLSTARYTLNSSTFINVYGGPELTHASWEASPQSELKKNHRHNPITYSNAVDNFHQPHYELHHQWKLNDRFSWDNSLYYIHGKGYYESFKASQKLYDFGFESFYMPDSTQITRTDLVRQKWVKKDQVGIISKIDWEHQGGTLTIGFDGYTFASDHWGKVTWAAQLPPGAIPEQNYYRYLGQKNLATIFAHELFKMTPQLSLMADVNLQLQKSNFKQKPEGNFFGVDRHAFEVSYAFFNPRAGVNYNLSNRWNLFANVSMANREPSDDDLYDIWQGPDDLGVAPLFAKADTIRSANSGVEYLNWSDPLTKSEQLLDFEVGAGYKSENIQMKLNGYWMSFQNEIVPYSQVDKDGFPIKGNADRTVHRGIEGSLAYKITGGFELTTAFALSQNYFSKFDQYEAIYDADWNFIGSRTINYNGKTIAGFPGTMANVKLKYSRGALTSYLFLQYAGKQYLDNNEMEDRSIPSFSLANFYISYQLENIPGLKGIKLGLWVNNILDKTYETAGYYDSWAGENYLWPGAKRNFFIGLETNL